MTMRHILYILSIVISVSLLYIGEKFGTSNIFIDAACIIGLAILLDAAMKIGAAEKKNEIQNKDTNESHVGEFADIK